MADNRLGKDRISRLFVVITIPVVLQQFFLLLNSLVDRIWIAHIPEIGELSFTASGICVPIIYIIFALSELLGTGITPRVGWLPEAFTKADVIVARKRMGLEGEVSYVISRWLKKGLIAKSGIDKYSYTKTEKTHEGLQKKPGVEKQ